MTAMEEAEMPTNTDGEAEAGSVPTGGPALFMSTQGPGEGVPLVRLKSRLGADPSCQGASLRSVQQIQRSLSGVGGHLPDQIRPLRERVVKPLQARGEPAGGVGESGRLM